MTANMLASNGECYRDDIAVKNVKLGTSDVDENIPENPTSNTKTFAVVIANVETEAVMWQAYHWP